jgi:hypothetical protein
MLAFAFMTLFLTSSIILSTTMEALHREAVSQLEKMSYASSYISSSTLVSKLSYGNDTVQSILDPLTMLETDYRNAWGRDSCDPRLAFDASKIQLYNTGVNLGSNNPSTDLEVRNNIGYLSTDGTTASAPDFYIVDLTNPNSPSIISSLNTGPGIAALEVAGPYIYAANLSTTNQLQVIDVSNRSAPVLVTKFKLPLPQASSTPPLATSIFYSKGLIYLGTQKWEGGELSIIDVTNPLAPTYLNSFETNTVVNNMYVRDGFAYLASADAGQMRILDVHNPSTITEVSEFSGSGWQTQTGKTLSYFEGIYSLGRTTGGFNVTTNHEIFTFSASSTSQATPQNSHDIPGGVYGIIQRPPNIYLATHFTTGEFQVWKDDLSSQVFNLSLGFSPTSLACDGRTLYFSTGNDRGIAVLKIN